MQSIDTMCREQRVDLVIDVNDTDSVYDMTGNVVTQNKSRRGSKEK